MIEPAFKAGGGLVQEHAEAVDDLRATLPRLDQKLGHQGRVDEIGDDGPGVECVEGHAEIGFAGHAEGGGVDDEGGTVEHIGGLNPVVDVKFRAEVMAQALGAGAGAIGQADFGDASLDQGGDDGAGGTTGAKECDGTVAGLPVRGVLAKVGHETKAIGVVGVDLAILAEDQGVGGTNQSGAVGDDIGEGKDGFLVRDGDVQADEADFGEKVQGLAQVVLGEVEGDIVALDAVAFEPIAVQSGRAAVGYGMADDTGEGDAGQVGHDAMKPRRVR